MKTTKTDRKLFLQEVLHGTTTEYAGVATLMLGGVAVPTGEFVGKCQAELDAMDATAHAKVAYASAVSAEKKARASVTPDVRLFRKLVEVQHGDTVASAAALAVFGFKPRKPATTSPKAKVKAAEKALATRAARHTMGPKQKALITGASPPQPAPSNSPQSAEATSADASILATKVAAPHASS